MNNISEPKKHMIHISREQVIVDAKIFAIAVIVLIIGLVFYTQYAQKNITASHASEGTSSVTTFLPVSDTYANQSNPSNTYAGKPMIITKNGSSTKKNIFLKFDLTKTANTIITGARLRVKVSDGSTANQNYHLLTTSTWSDSTLSWNNAPVINSPIAGTSSNTKSGTWVEVPLDSVAAQMTGKVITIAIDTPNGDDVFGIDSKETLNAPQLIISTSTLGGTVQISPTNAPLPTIMQATPAFSLAPNQPSPVVTLRPTDLPVPTDIPPTKGPTPTFAPVSGQTYYISPNGSDSSTGKDANAPLKTFNKAMSMLRPGDILYMRGGDYYENVSPKLTSGRPDAKITMKNYPGERPVIHGLFIMSGPSYWVFDGLNVTWPTSGATSGDHMTKFTGGAVGWELKNCEIWGAHSYAGMSITGFTNHWTISNCVFHDTYKSNDTNQDHLIYANDASYGVIEHSVFLNSPNGRGLKLGPPSGGGAGPNNIVARFNTFYNNEGPANIQVSGGTSNNTFENNILVKPAAGGKNITVNSGYFGKNSVARNNIGWLSSGMFEPGIVDGGGNVTNVDPQINFNIPKRADGSYIMDANSFKPANTTATRYGKFGN